MAQESASVPPVVHALLVCRAVDAGAQGEISIQNVIEVVPATSVPGTVGPLTFVAFVRNLPAGPAEAAFVLHAPRGADGEPAGPAQKIPLRVDLPPGLEDRQLALHVTAPEVPVVAPGWHEIHFEWQGTPLAANRFAVGLRG